MKYIYFQGIHKEAVCCPFAQLSNVRPRLGIQVLDYCCSADTLFSGRILGRGVGQPRPKIKKPACKCSKAPRSDPPEGRNRAGAKSPWALHQGTSGAEGARSTLAQESRVLCWKVESWELARPLWRHRWWCRSLHFDVPRKLMRLFNWLRFSLTLPAQPCYCC